MLTCMHTGLSIHYFSQETAAPSQSVLQKRVVDVVLDADIERRMLLDEEAELSSRAGDEVKVAARLAKVFARC